jgi:HAD superfamily hydrolase (TIGR01662 family)
MPGRKEKLQALAASGVKLLGVSNQGDIARYRLTVEQAKACFERTNELLGVKIEYVFCPHNPAPIQCYCRKPMPGLGVQFIERYKLDRNKVVYVGDMTTDKTFAARSLIKYIDQAAYFPK